MERGMNKGETFIKLFLVISLVLGVGLGLKEKALSSEMSDQEIREIMTEKIPRLMEKIRKGLEEDPSQDLSDIVHSVYFWGREINKAYPRMVEIYQEVFEKSTHVDTVVGVVDGLGCIGETKSYKRKKMVLPILMKALSHPFIDVRLRAARWLFEWGYKKEVYPVYVGIVMKDPKELKDELENRPLWESIKMDLGSQRFKEDPDYREDRHVTITYWRIAPIINAIEKLIEYDDSRTRKLVRKALFENEYISSVVTKFRRDIETQRLKTKELERTWAKERERKMKLFERLDAYLRKQ